MIARIEDFKNITMKTVMVDEIPIIISRIGGQFYAINAICSHAYGYLPRGKTEDACISCPVHHAQFDLKTGRMTKNVPGLIKMAVGGAKDLVSYELKIDNEGIWINV